MSVSRMLGLLLKKWPYVVVVLSLAVYGYIERNSPRQPDPASGHVFRVIAPKHRKTERHVMYLTGTERYVYHGSLIVGAACFFGIVGQMFFEKNRRAAERTPQPPPAPPPE